MIIDNKVAEVHNTIEFSESVDMGVDMKEFASVLASLTDIYQDPYEAILREYTSNAYDAHVASGDDSLPPIQVSLPTALHPNLIIQDFGVGMSRVQLRETFSRYGSSTKRASNEQVGAFGLGSKSALALVSQFIVTSVQDGLENTVIISKNQEKVPGLNFLEEKPTNARNGVTVTIPIPDPARTLHVIKMRNIFIGWEPGVIEIDGEAPSAGVHSDSYKAFDAGWVKSSTFSSSNGRRNTYYYHNERASVKALLGPVAYDVPLKEIFEEKDFKRFTKQWHQILSHFVLNIEIGSVQVIRSRDSFLFNANTKAVLKEKLLSLAGSLEYEFESRIESATTHAEALKALETIDKETGLDFELKWKNEVIPRTFEIGRNNAATHQEVKWLLVKKKKSDDRNWVELHYSSIPLIGSGKQNVILVTDCESLDKGWDAEDKPFDNWAELRRNLSEVYRFHGEETPWYLLTTKKAAKVSPWLLAISQNVMSAEEVQAKAKESRRIRENERRQQKKLDGAPVITGGTIRLVHFQKGAHKNDTPFAKVYMNASEIPRRGRVAYVNFTENPVTDAEKTANVFYEVFAIQKIPTHWLQAQDSADFRFVSAVFNLKKNTRIAIIPKGRNVAKFLEAQPTAIHCVELVKEARDLLENLTVEQRWELSGRANSDGLKKVKKDSSALSLIASEQTRNQIVNAYSYLYSNSAFGKESSSLLEKVAKDFQDEKEVIAKSPSVGNFVKSARKMRETDGFLSYPLIEHEGYSGTFKMADIIEYINLKDAARNV